MKKITVLCFFGIICINLLKSQIVEFNFNTAPYLNVSANNANLTVSDMQLSTGTIGVDKTTTSDFSSLPYIEESTGWTATELSNATFFYVDIADTHKFIPIKNT
jgi:hypothetical protein